MPDDNSPLDTDVAKPWYRSTTLQGLVVMLGNMVLQQILKNNDPAASDALAVVVNAIFAGVGAAMVIYGRFKAKKTLTGTAAAAAKLNG